MDIATIAGSDTYIALGTIAQGTDGAVLLKVECAALPFPTTNTCWIKADVPIILSTDIVDNTNNCFVSSLSLDIVGSRLYAAARVNTSSGDVIVLGECTNPISDLKHWKFTELHSGRGDSVFLSAEDSRLCLVCNDYGESDSSILYIGTCEACASSSPAAWRWCQTSFECSLLGSTMYYQNGLAIAYGWMNQTAGLFALDTDLYANTTTEPTRITTPIPGIEKFASVMNIQDKPAVASFDCGDPGRVVYAWSDKAIPHRKSDWHLCTVYEGKASGIVDPQPVVEGDGWLVQAVTSWRVWIFALSLCIVIFGVLAAIHKARRRKAAAKPARQ